MIRISLTNTLKKEIEDHHVKLLAKLNIKGKIKDAELVISRTPALHSYLFSVPGVLNDKNYEELILADKKKMEDIIRLIGVLSDDLGAPKKFSNSVFDYKSFSNSKGALEFLHNLNVNVCPYCNRQYTFTLKRGGSRPQFDHYYPKNKYPYLAVSLYNLVPSCGLCNQSKSIHDTYTDPILYPYEEEFGNDVLFHTEPIKNDISYWTGSNSDFKIVINNNVGVKADKAIQKFHLEELYKLHKDYVRDIIRNANFYSEDRVDELLKNFPELFSDRNDVVGSLFMNYFGKDGWGNRPLSKLTHDIFNEFVINQNKLV